MSRSCDVLIRLGLSDELRGVLPQEGPVLPPGVPAAVVVPVVEAPDPFVLLTVRTQLVRDHKGEIAFPGGVRHAEDPSLRVTALRETEEELGIPRDAFDVPGALPPVQTFVSGYVIQPFVGVLAAPPRITPSRDEIGSVLEAPIADLLRVEREVRGPAGPMVVYDVGEHVVWGATGRILRSFLDILRDRGWT